MQVPLHLLRAPGVPCALRALHTQRPHPTARPHRCHSAQGHPHPTQAPRTPSCSSITCQPGDSVLCLRAGLGQWQEKVSCCAQQPRATGGALSLLPSRLVQTKAAAASVPPGAAGPGGSMRAVPPLSAAILSICIWRAAINAPRRACSLPPPPDPLLSVDKPQNGLLSG